MNPESPPRSPSSPTRSASTRPDMSAGFASRCVLAPRTNIAPPALLGSSPESPRCVRTRVTR
jgi:hypothetical protein